MYSFKELTITKMRSGILAQLPLTGQWLEELGFRVGEMVNVSWGDSCLTLTTNPTVKNHACVLMVESKLTRKRPQTQLVLNGLLLKRYGFHIGDQVGLHLFPNKIQITKINRFTTEQPTVS